MMKAVHFGAGNIGRGFIGEILAKNDFSMIFIDVNETVIRQLQEKKSYTIAYADESEKKIEIEHVTGINNATHPQSVIEAIKTADIITTAIGPNILPKIAELIAQGIQARESENVQAPLDIIACENMIGGSSFLKNKVEEYITNANYLETFIGFPNAAVDRIVPIQSHNDPLFVQVEPFCEWVVETKDLKSSICLSGVNYVENLEPYIERKLFSVNTGHATVAYTGAFERYQTIDAAMQDPLVVVQLRSVLEETGNLLIKKWGFNQKEHQQYIDKIVQRFKNKYISDTITRVARTPIRKLGNNERFIQPILELESQNDNPVFLYQTVGMIFNYYDQEDEQSQTLQQLIKKNNLEEVIKKVTSIDNQTIIDRIKKNIERYSYC